MLSSDPVLSYPLSSLSHKINLTSGLAALTLRGPTIYTHHTYPCSIKYDIGRPPPVARNAASTAHDRLVPIWWIIRVGSVGQCFILFSDAPSWCLLLSTFRQTVVNSGDLLVSINGEKLTGTNFSFTESISLCSRASLPR